MLPEPGTPQYLPRLLLHIDEVFEETSGTTWSFDTVLFSTLLLARIAKRGGVIIDVASGSAGSGGGKSRERREEIGRVVSCVRVICESIFGQSTTTSPLSHGSSARDLPYSLLLDPPAPPSPRKPKRPRPKHVRPPSGVSLPTGQSSRYATALPSPAASTSPLPSHPDEPPGFYVQGGTGPPTATTTPGVTPKASMSLHPWSSTPGAFDRAMWPSGPLDAPRTHPPPPPAPAPAPPPSVPDVAIISGLENTTSAIWIKLAEILTTRRILLSPKRKSALSVEAEGLLAEASSIQEEVEQVWEKEGLECGNMMVVWVRDEDEAEKCPGWLLDYFACSAVVFPDSLEMPPSELRHQAIIPSDYMESLSALLAYTHIHPTLQIHLSNLVSAVSGHARLSSTLTARFVTSLPSFVRAHRLLSAPFDLPIHWADALNSTADEDVQRTAGKWGLGGGPGGVDTWAALAGEEPSMRDLAKRANRRHSHPVGMAGEREEEQWEGEDIYTTPENARAAFELCVRHRVRLREEREEVMWLLKGNAAGLVHDSDKGAEGGEGKRSGKSARRKRDEVDRILADIQRLV